MTEYWKSTPKKWCNACKTFIADNKASIDRHESGRRHRENSRNMLSGLWKTEQEKSISLDEQKKTLAQVNYLAQQSYRSDILRGHRAQQSTNQPRLVSNHDANSGAYWAAAAASASAAAKAQAAAVDTVENNQASLHDEPETVDTPNLHLDAVYSSQPYGEWVPVETEPSATKVFDAESTSSRVESTSLFTAADTEPIVNVEFEGRETPSLDRFKPNSKSKKHSLSTSDSSNSVDKGSLSGLFKKPKKKPKVENPPENDTLT